MNTNSLKYMTETNYWNRCKSFSWEEISDVDIEKALEDKAKSEIKSCPLCGLGFSNGSYNFLEFQKAWNSRVH